MCILKIEKCGTCDTESADIYRCTNKLLELYAPPCNFSSNVVNRSNTFVCIVCTLEQRGYEGVSLVVELIEVDCELKKEALSTTGSDSYTIIM